MHAGISCDIQSQYSWGGRNTCSDSVCMYVCVCKREVDVEQTEISPLHHWVNGTTDVSCDFTAASWRVTLKPTHEHIAHQSEWGVLCFPCMCWGKQWQPPPQVHTCTPGMSRMSGDGNEKEKKKKSIWFHASLSRSLTDCDLPLLRNGKEMARPRCHKTTQSGC